MARGTGRLGSRSRVALWALLAALLIVGVSSLVWIAYRAVGEWRRSTSLLVEQRSEEALTLLTVALSRDMKGVHHSVLASFDERWLDFDRRYDLDDLFAQAFARFPYPESFFVWRDVPGGRGPSTYVFNRVDRQPSWADESEQPGAFPVVAIADPPIARDVVARIRELGGGARFAAFDTTLNGRQYQIVVHVLTPPLPDRAVNGAVGFIVNLDWVRAHYFDEILGQISRIGRLEEGLVLSVVDDRGQVVASTENGSPAGGVGHDRPFPLQFLDGELIGDRAHLRTGSDWALHVTASDDRMLEAASRGATRTIWLMLLSAGVAVMGIVFTVRALKASADLTTMQSEFVASATHELKTPLALFQLVADTLAKGRYGSAETIRTYGTMLSEQTHLLERLIDNVLAYASPEHVAQRYRFQSLAVAELVEAALERFDATLAATGLEVNVDLPANLPAVRGDRVTLLQALDNVIDNAIKYSPQGQALSIAAAVEGPLVRISVSDQGPGIPIGEREKVFEKFYRGTTTVAGTGLGLAIARRVITDHSGTIGIRDTEPHGTTIDFRLPIAT